MRSVQAGLLSFAVLVLAGCGSATAVSSTTRSPQTAAGGAAQRCARSAHLSPGAGFPAWHLGVVRFSSASTGLGLTTSVITCDRRLPTGGAEVGQRPQVTQLAATSDGGRSWRLTGSPLPTSATRGGLRPEQLVATSSSALWAVVGTGRLVATIDAGDHWTVQPLPGTVSDIQVAGGTVWALTCVPVRPHAFACHPQLWRTRGPHSDWSRVRLPSRTAVDPQSMQLAVLPGSVIVGVIGQRGQTASFQLLRSDDLGRRWDARSVRRRGQPCGYGTALITEPPATAWLLCNAAGAAGSSPKTLLRTTDGGQTWQTVSGVTLTRPPRPRELPAAEPAALAAGSPSRLWLSGYNDLTVSNDGGRRWDQVRGVNPQGAPSTFDVLDPSHAWLLGFDNGLWRTTDGVHWHRIGPLHAS